MPIQGNDQFPAWARALQKSLDEEAVNRCATSLLRHQCDDGGFRGRSTVSDIYYTFFATACLALIGRSPDNASLKGYLKSFGDGTGLDLVHACCLLRCRDLMRLLATPDILHGVLSSAAISGRLLSHTETPLRCHIRECLTSRQGIYDWFLALTSLNEPGSADIIDPVLKTARRPDGGFSGTDAEASTTTVTAAGIWLSHSCGTVDQRAVEWLLAQKRSGTGFAANAAAPMPDLLSTATAVQALSVVGVDLKPMAEDILTFTESCWGPTGQFKSSPCDTVEDPEYTFYGLLTLACLLT